MDTSLLSRRARLVGAAVNFGLTSYATLTVAALRMLHCVWVPGTAEGATRLFIRASLACDFRGWQAPIVGVVGLLLAVPIGGWAPSPRVLWYRSCMRGFPWHASRCGGIRVGVCVRGYACIFVC
jgi:hypothetical protein